MLKLVAFLTSPNYQSVLDKCPDFLDEFQTLKPIFLQYNIDLIKANWRDSATDWKSFSAVIPKACWDYKENPSEFEGFLKKMLSLNIPMINDANTVLWNMRKTYLLDLQKLSLPVGELIIIPQYSEVNSSNLLEQMRNANFPSQTVVAKPSIGGGAIDTVRFNIENIHSHEGLFKKILSYADLILQPYFPEIGEVGEYSYFFFNHQFSHAILKKPASGDYRAHQIYGAENISYQPSGEEINKAFTFISNIPYQCNYARVDVFKRNHELYLIELELIEPYLYFEHASSSSLHSFCQSIVGNSI